MYVLSVPVFPRWDSKVGKEETRVFTRGEMGVSVTKEGKNKHQNGRGTDRGLKGGVEAVTVYLDSLAPLIRIEPFSDHT